MIRKFQASDAQAASHLICRNLREVNCRDYAPDVIEQLIREHTPEHLLQMAAEGRTFIAEKGGTPIGILRVLPSQETPQEYWLCTIFVSPDYHGHGIGRQLVKAGEQFVRQAGGSVVRLCASLTAHRFYQKLGYRDLSGEPDSDGLYPMEKILLI